MWCAATATAMAAGPVNTAPPAITGIAQQGQSLVLTPGAWSDATGVTVTDTWETCSGMCSAISPQPGGPYSLAAADVGQTVVVVETATATDGTATVTSGPTPAVIALAPVSETPPTIGGTAQEGQLLTLTRGQWSNSPTISDQWERCTGATCSPINGQTATPYTVAAADAGHTLEVSETATNSGGSATASSAPTQTIVAPPAEVSAPLVVGTASESSLLTEAHGTWSGAPTTYGYQWYRCGPSVCAAVSGATSQSYSPVAADIGSALLVAEVASNAGGPSAPADSALTSVVTGPATIIPVPVDSSPPTTSGAAQQGQTLVEAHGSWSGNPISYRYQWEACGSAGCAEIPGATGQSYTLTAADVGKRIVVLESAFSATGFGTPAPSAPTAPVITTAATSLAVLPNSPSTNQEATLVATVTSGSAGAPPSGSLTFFDGTRALPGCAGIPLQASGQSAGFICQSSFAAGISQLTVAYSPGAGVFVGASVSAPVMLDVGRGATSTSLAVTKQVGRGKRATYAATIVLPLSNSGPVQPTGAIQFLDRGRPIRRCLDRPLRRLVATCVISYGSVGKHEISARYAGDPNFVPSTSSSRSMLVVQHVSRPAVLGFVSATLQWQFEYHRAYTLVTMLAADRLAKGMTVVLACRGRSCPFGRLSFPAAADAAIDLQQPFHKRRLRPGSEITVRITHSRWIGKYYSFTVRSGRGPVIVLSCLGVSQARPGSEC
jgi:hypothetical protein